MNLLAELYRIDPPPVPRRVYRVYSVWARHWKVYLSHPGNYFPPVFEPLIVFLACKYGLAPYLNAQFPQASYIAFVIPALAAHVSMWSPSFECTFECFMRLHYASVYQVIVASPVGVRDLLIGEIAFAASKSFLFSVALLLEMFFLGELDFGFAFVIPFVALVSGVAFAGFALLVTSRVRSIYALNFYISAVLVPMTFFSGSFFPLEEMSLAFQYLGACLPLTYVVSVMRDLAFAQFSGDFVLDCAVIALFAGGAAFLGLRGMEKVLVR